ncbi:MAG TPA: ankyrin repeat domain-containing protein [Nocardioidaceae bacterium]|nr:ankyrin repeat domain-containing protein [Nocardioidaceae bacterium]
MRRPAGAATVAAVLTTLVLGACGTADAPPSPAAPRSTPAKPQPTSPRLQPSVAPTRTVPPRLSAEEQRRLDQRLRDATWANDVAKAHRLVRRGADVNAKDDTVQSAYLITTSEGYLDLLRLTLRNGAQINDKDSWNGTGLIRAAERGHHGVVGELLRAGIDRDHVNRIGYQAIHEAVWLGEDTPAYATTLRVLAAGGVQLDRPSRDEGLTPLQMARTRGYAGLESVLTQVTACERAVDAEALLLRAAAAGDADAATCALRSGAEVSARDRSGRTSLQWAIARGHVDVVDLLVAMGARKA